MTFDALAIAVGGLLGAFDQGLFQRGGTRLCVHRGNWNVGLPPRMGIASEVVRLDIGGPGQ